MHRNTLLIFLNGVHSSLKSWIVSPFLGQSGMDIYNVAKMLWISILSVFVLFFSPSMQNVFFFLYKSQQESRTALECPPLFPCLWIHVAARRRVDEREWYSTGSHAGSHRTHHQSPCPKNGGRVFLQQICRVSSIKAVDISISTSSSTVCFKCDRETTYCKSKSLRAQTMVTVQGFPIWVNCNFYESFVWTLPRHTTAQRIRCLISSKDCQTAQHFRSQLRDSKPWVYFVSTRTRGFTLALPEGNVLLLQEGIVPTSSFVPPLSKSGVHLIPWFPLQIESSMAFLLFI